MILRDPVHGLVAFEGIAEQVIGRLLATREVQRLRNVRQLGFTSFVFPGAEHSRFAHSVGAAHVMVRLLSRMHSVRAALPRELVVDDEAEADVLAAVLLHDLGHGPFSHLYEEVLPDARPHEGWTVDIIRDPSTDVHRALRGLSSEMPERVAGLIEGRHRLGYLARCVSGTLDADRCDYLLRDSHMTGVRYGIYDLDWLLRALSFGELPSGEWVLAIEGRKGLPPIEGFFLARQFMYQQVYHHKATRCAEALIRAIFMRVAELVRAGTPPSPMPAALARACVGDAVPLGEYMALDDITLLASFRAWEDGGDATLSALCKQLALRDLPKTIPLDERGDEREWQAALTAARAIASARGLRPELSVQLDVATDIPYYEPEDSASAEGLFVLIRNRPIERLGRASFLLGQLRNLRIARPRLVLPEAIRSEVLAEIEHLLGARVSEA